MALRNFGFHFMLTKALKKIVGYYFEQTKDNGIIRTSLKTITFPIALAQNYE